MIFNTPFIAFQSELLNMLMNADEIDFSIYDSCLSIDEILADLKILDNVHYGIVADVSCTPSSAKVDTIMWLVNVRIEVFSTYKGRLQVAEMINTIGNVATKYVDVFSRNLNDKRYSVIRQEIGESTIGPALTANGLTWQNGYINLKYYLSQLDS